MAAHRRAVATAPRSEEPALAAVIETERLTKSYGAHRGIIELDLEVGAGRGLRVPRARTAPARRRRCGSCSTSSGRRAAGPTVFGIETTVDPVAIHRRVGYLPGEFDLYDRLTGAADDRLLRRTCAAAWTGPTSTRLVERLDLDPSRRFKRVLARATSRRSGWSSRSSTGPTCSSSTSRRRASTRSSSRRSSSSSARRSAEGRTIFLSSPHHRRGRPDLRSGRDHPRGPPRPGRPHRGHPRPRLPPRRADASPSRCAPAIFEATWRASATSRPTDDVVQDAGQRARSARSSPSPPRTVWSTWSAASRTSRTSSWPSTAPRPASAAERERGGRRFGRSAGPGTGPWSRLMGLRFGLWQDASVTAAAPRSSSALVAGAVHVRDRRAVRGGTGVLDDRARDAQFIAGLTALPLALRGLLGEPINVETLGGFLSWRIGNTLAAMLRSVVGHRAVRYARWRSGQGQPRHDRREAVRPAPGSHSRR